MAARVKDETKALTRRWIIRASPQDDRLARERARQVGCRFSDYIRRMSVDGRIVLQPEGGLSGDPIVSLTAALNRVGNLVNQQMAIAHSQGRLPQELLRLDAMLEQTIAAVLARQEL